MHLLCRYGLGQIAYRQEKWESAIFHFRSSIKVGCVLLLMLVVMMRRACLLHYAKGAVMALAAAAASRTPTCHTSPAQQSCAQINPSSSVLRCYLGMALAKAGEPDQALDVLGGAIQRDPRNPLASFERASVLLQYARLEDALIELEALKVCAEVQLGC